MMPLNDPKTVDIDGIKTRYFEGGRGKDVVLIHGGHYGDFSSSFDWGLNIKALTKNFHMFAFDKLGMGYTDNPKSNDDYTMEATICHAYQFLLAENIRNAVLIGHSRGAFAATCLALEHPEIVESLVIVDSATLAPDNPSIPSSKDFYARLDRELSGEETKDQVRKKIRANSFSDSHMTDDFLEQSYGVESLQKTRENRNKMVQLMESLFLPHLNSRKKETIETIKSGGLRQPTLIIWGMNDPSAPLELGIDLFRLIATKNEKTQLNVLNHAGHYSFREQAVSFNNVVTVFLKPDLLFGNHF